MISERYLPIWGGAENQLRQLIPHLRRHGCDVKVVTRRWHGSFPRQEIIDGTMIVRLGIPGGNSLSTLIFVISLVWYVFRKRNEIDLLHSHGAVLLGSLCALLSKQLGLCNVAKIATAGRVPTMTKSLVGRAVLYFFKQSSAIVSMTEEIDRELSDIKMEPRRIARIPNGVDCQRFLPGSQADRLSWRLQQGLEEQDKLVLFSSRLVPRKGLDILLEAWRAVSEHCPDAHLLIVGSGRDQPDSVEREMKEKVRTERLQRIRFIGETDAPEYFLGLSDLFVFPSRLEGFPNALLEAMACGMAIVASDIGGVRAVIGRSDTACLFRLEDSTGLANAVIELLNDPGRRLAMGKKARLRMLSRFSFEHTADQYVFLYHNCLSNSSKGISENGPIE